MPVTAFHEKVCVTVTPVALLTGATSVGATSGEMSRQGAPVGLWAVLIGVSRYQYGDQDLDGNHISNLKHAADDAEAMHDFLRSPEGGGFQEDHIF